MSRQNWYKGKKVRQRKQVDEGLVVELVKTERQLQTRLGTRKLQVTLKQQFSDSGIDVGRDRLFEILRKNDLLLKRLPKSHKTTNSKHSLPLFPNIVKDIDLTGPNEAWCSDITYIRTEESFVYLSLIMDLHSRMIVGYHSGDSLEAIGCLKALDMALEALPEGCRPVHHSDRGCQYCSHDYVKNLCDNGLGVSMTETNHCAENAHAERLNGILKQEYALGMTFRNAEQVRLAVDQAVHLYNYRRPHLKLQMKVPAEVHRQAA
jgi:transposase InsO family protein